MRTLAAILLLLVAVVHYSADLLAAGYPDPGSARKVISYLLRSIEGAIQYAVIAVLALVVAWLVRAKEPGRLKGAAPVVSSVRLVVLVCCWGVVEQLQVGVCRLGFGISNRPPDGAPLTGLCDRLVGLPLYATGLAVIAFLAAVIAAHWGEKHA